MTLSAPLPKTLRRTNPPRGMLALICTITVASILQVSGFVVPEYGNCTLSCSGPLASDSPCAIKLNSAGCCLCGNSHYLTSLATCVGSECGASELNQTASAITAACSENCNQQPSISEQQFLAIGLSQIPTSTASTVSSTTTTTSTSTTPIGMIRSWGAD